MLSNISRALVGLPGKTDEIIRQATLCTFVSFPTTYFLLRPPAQDTHAYDMIGRITAVYIHFVAGRSALRLRLTGSVEQPMSYYGPLA